MQPGLGVYYSLSGSSNALCCSRVGSFLCTHLFGFHQLLEYPMIIVHEQCQGKDARDCHQQNSEGSGQREPAHIGEHNRAYQTVLQDLLFPEPEGYGEEYNTGNEPSSHCQEDSALGREFRPVGGYHDAEVAVHTDKCEGP